MNKLKLSNGSEYYLSNYAETSSTLTLTISGCLVAEIKALTEEALKKVQIFSESDVLVGTFSNMTLGNSISYNTSFDQTIFSLIKSGVGDLASQVTELQNQVKELQDALSEQQTQIATISNTGETE